MTVKSLRKQLAAAVAMTLVATVALGSSTYAWFTMNKEVTATGMQMQTVVESNLQIDDAAPTNGGSWSAGSFATNDSTFKNATIQTIANEVLVPVSTVDGYSYWYTDPNNVKGSGDAITDAYTAYTLEGLKGKYGASVTHGYLDYHFILKATNTTDDAQYVVLKQLQMTYTAAGEETDTDKAWRVAILGKKFATAAVNGAKTLPGVASSGAEVTKIYTPSGASNFTSGKAVKTATGLDTVTYANAVTDSSIFTVTAGKTEYFEVVVRVWIEGEDTTCYTGLFNDLQDGTWALNIGFELAEDTTNGVFNITMQ